MIKRFSMFVSLAILFATPPLSAEELGLNRVILKQGCALSYPATLHVLDKTHVKSIEESVADAAAQSPPSFRAKVTAATLAFAAVDDKEQPDLRVTLLILPPEVSQEDLKGFDSTMQAALRDTMFEQVAPQFRQLGISVTKKWPAMIREGDHLSYFLWGYEFQDQEKVPKISLRAYYYTSQATFSLQVTCTKSVFDAKRKDLGRVLDSFSTRL